MYFAKPLDHLSWIGGSFVSHRAHNKTICLISGWINNVNLMKLILKTMWNKQSKSLKRSSPAPNSAKVILIPINWIYSTVFANSRVSKHVFEVPERSEQQWHLSTVIWRCCPLEDFTSRTDWYSRKINRMVLRVLKEICITRVRITTMLPCSPCLWVFGEAQLGCALKGPTWLCLVFKVLGPLSKVTASTALRRSKTSWRAVWTRLTLWFSRTPSSYRVWENRWKNYVDSRGEYFKEF